MSITAARSTTSWLQLAACRGGDTSLWFATEGSFECRVAVAVCRHCPVRQPCLANAVAVEHEASEIIGVRGGLTAVQRRLSSPAS